MKALLANRLLLVLGFLGLFVAGFLSIAHALSAVIPCGVSSGCDKVTSGPGSTFGGVPVAYFGAFGYLVLTAMAAYRAFRGLDQTRGTVMPGYVIAAIGTVASVYLQFLSLVVIKAVCWWCLSSAVIMVLTLIVYAVLAQNIDDAPAESLPKDPWATPMVAGLAAAVVLGLGGGGSMLKTGGAATATTDLSKPKVPFFLPDSHSFGDATAKLTIVEFADMYCPACRTSSPKLKEFVQANPGKVRLVYRHFPLLQKHPLALNAALIAEAAADEGKFWDYLIAVMQLPLEEAETETALYDVAESNGLDVEKIKKRIGDAKDPIYVRVQRDMEAADKLGLQGTPTFVLLLENRPADLASSNDLWEKLQAPPYKEFLAGSGQ